METDHLLPGEPPAAPAIEIQWIRFGMIRAISSISCLEWSYVIPSLLGLLICFAVTVERLANHLEPNSSDFTFALLLVLTIVFCCYYVIHSVLTESGDKLLVFVVVNGIILLYCITSFVNEGITDLAMEYRMIVVCIMSPLLIVFGIYLSWYYFNSSAFVSAIVGDDPNLQNSYKWFSICYSLLELNLQLQLSMLILILGNQSADLDEYQKIIFPTGIFLAVIFAVVGFIALRRESFVMVIAFLLIGTPQPVYVATKLNYAASHKDDSVTLYTSTIICGCLALVVWLMLVVCTAYFAKCHFDKGLKERLNGQAPNNAPQPINAPPDDFDPAF